MKLGSRILRFAPLQINLEDKRRNSFVHCERKYAGRTSDYRDGTIQRLEFPKVNSEPVVLSIARVKGRIYCVGASCSHYSAPLYNGVVDGTSVLFRLLVYLILRTHFVLVPVACILKFNTSNNIILIYRLNNNIWYY